MFQTKTTVRVFFAAAMVGIAQSSNATPTLISLATVANPVLQNLVVDSSGNVIGTTEQNVFELSGPGHQTMTTLFTELLSKAVDEA